MIRGIHHMAVNTPNFDAMIKFYRDALGFVQVGGETKWESSKFGDRVIGVKNAAGRLTTLKAGNIYFELFEFSSPPSRPDGPARPNDHGYTHFCVEVHDIDGELNRLKELGMKFNLDTPPDFGGVRSVYGTDPDGNVIELREVVPDGEHQFGDLDFSPTRP